MRLSCTGEGVRVGSIQQPHAASAAFGIWFAVGSRDEPSDAPGISHLAEHVLATGINNSQLCQSDEAIVRLADNETKAYTGKEYVAINTRAPATYGIAPFQRILRNLNNGEYSEESFLFQKNRALAELDANAKSNYGNLRCHMDEMAWPDHSLARCSLGDPDYVRGATISDVVEFINSYLLDPSNIIIVAAGRHCHEELLAACSTIPPSSSPRPTSTQPSLPAVTSQPVSRVIPSVNDAYALVGFRAYGRKHADCETLRLLSSMCDIAIRPLGTPPPKEIYDFAPDLRAYRDTGLLSFRLAVNPERARSAAEYVFKALGRVRQGSDSKRLFDVAWRLHTAKQDFIMDSPLSIASLIGERVLYGLPMESPLGAGERTPNIDESDCIRVARDVFKPENLIVVGGSDQVCQSILDAVPALYCEGEN